MAIHIVREPRDGCLEGTRWKKWSKNVAGVSMPGRRGGVFALQWRMVRMRDIVEGSALRGGCACVPHGW